MRILISGAGIAGMTLAALLEQRGLAPTIIDKAPSSSHAGYMLGLYQLGYRVLYGLGLYDQFATESVECRSYQLHGGDGRAIARWSLDPIAGENGPLWSSTRPQLVELLRTAVRSEVSFNETITTIDTSRADVVDVTFSSGTREQFDLLVGADGIGSAVRDLVVAGHSRYDTGWGGWVWWADDSVCPADAFVEYWGAARFVGLYPTRAGVGVFAGAPSALASVVPEGRRNRVKRHFSGMGNRIDTALDFLPDDQERMFH